MFCPRCGRQVNDNANFCGGCGLSKREIDSQLSQKNSYTYTAPVFEKAPPQTGEVENFVEQPFPTDVEFKDVEETSSTPASERENTDTATPPNYTQAPQYQYGYQQQEQYQWDKEEIDDKTLSTVDFLWMMIITIIPIIGLGYLLYLAFAQSKNINKRSYARAMLILFVFITLIVSMFVCGFFMANFLF